jgi:hypothetical protein
MIIRGYAIAESLRQHRIDFLNNGREIIKKFPTLFSILNDFPGFIEDKYDSNDFLNSASKAKFNVFIGGPDERSLNRLKEYENILREIDLQSYPREKRNQIKQRMNLFGDDNHEALVKELQLLIQLKKSKIFTDVVYDKFDESNHDFRFFIDKNEFNLEFTSLGKSLPTRIIEKSFNGISEELIKLIPDKHLLRLRVKTDQLLNSDGEMDEDYIKGYLIEKIKEILPIITVNLNGHFMINSNLGDQKKSLWEARSVFGYFNEFGERLQSLTVTKNGRDYLKKTKIAQIADCPIKSISIMPRVASLVEIHSEGVFPSEAERLRTESLIRQIRNSVEQKIKENQLDGQTNPIIAIQFDDVLFMNYTDSTDYLSEDYIQKLSEPILEALLSEVNEDILGVLLIENYIENSIFIKNPNSVIDSNVLGIISKISMIV